MHPPLIPERHPMCAKYMEALTRCHKEHSVAMWWGACNDAKFALTKCLAAEKKEMRAERQARAKEEYRQKQARDEEERERRRMARRRELEGQEQGQQQAEGQAG
ncbi:hypothetical protein Rsub_00288 [Raphidocelis subcapitata]|uniref:COX assembly mitochondrial protein n=1 Tax=Raphidocelis subcapitata TaxID=307507 RepID=A0A2V0NRM5_9CHLO|nr:hypothetical protein Rsub_00288 [Raphidocelis subcapitata]|eukprot:GBF87577.1 hypothetical protein Rsub_00288 [Raphidocelis subcapitata]